MDKELEGQMSERLASLSNRHMKADTVLYLHLSDLREYAEKTEYLDRVRNSSEGIWTPGR